MHVMMISGVLMTCQQPSNKSVGYTHHLPVCACAGYKRQQCSVSTTINCSKKKTKKKKKEKRKEEKRRKKKKEKKKKKEEGKKKKKKTFQRQFNEKQIVIPG